MQTSHFKTLLHVAFAGITALLLTVAFAADTGTHKVVNGVSIYLGVLPAEMILGEPNTVAKMKMNGGVPAGRHQFHVVVALFDNATGKRITNAEVKATVREIGLSGVQKKLGPMFIAGTRSYGNYFNMPATNNPYRILVQIRLPGSTGVIEAEFEYRADMRSFSGTGN